MLGNGNEFPNLERSYELGAPLPRFFSESVTEARIPDTVPFPGLNVQKMERIFQSTFFWLSNSRSAGACNIGNKTN